MKRLLFTILICVTLQTPVFATTYYYWNIRDDLKVNATYVSTNSTGRLNERVEFTAVCTAVRGVDAPNVGSTRNFVSSLINGRSGASTDGIDVSSILTTALLPGDYIVNPQKLPQMQTDAQTMGYIITASSAEPCVNTFDLLNTWREQGDDYEYRATYSPQTASTPLIATLGSSGGGGGGGGNVSVGDTNVTNNVTVNMNWDQIRGILNDVLGSNGITLKNLDTIFRAALSVPYYLHQLKNSQGKRKSPGHFSMSRAFSFGKRGSIA